MPLAATKGSARLRAAGPVLAVLTAGVVLVLDRLAVAAAPSDEALAEIVRSRAGTVEARLALHALLVREGTRGELVTKLEEVLPGLADADLRFLAAARPDVHQRRDKGR